MRNYKTRILKGYLSGYNQHQETKKTQILGNLTDLNCCKQSLEHLNFWKEKVVMAFYFQIWLKMDIYVGPYA